MVDELVNSIMNVETNIKHYKELKKHCERCYREKCVYSNCEYWIPAIIHLDVMEKRKKELWDEYTQKHKGEIRYDGSII